jgi:type VI secretion system protein ImpH
LFSLVGLGTDHLRKRLCVASPRPQTLAVARVDDLALLYYSGLFAHRPRCAAGLQAILRDYFQLEVSVRQFQGQWLSLDPVDQSRLEEEDGNNQLGVTSVVGEQLWDVQSKFRIRVGPVPYSRFIRLLPDLSRIAEGNLFYLLSHLARLYVGPELDFDVQVVLSEDEVPECQLSEDGTVGALLGWNTWVSSLPLGCDAEDAVFEGEQVYFTGVDGAPGR